LSEDDAISYTLTWNRELARTVHGLPDPRNAPLIFGLSDYGLFVLALVFGAVVCVSVAAGSGIGSRMEHVLVFYAVGFGACYVYLVYRRSAFERREEDVYLKSPIVEVTIGPKGVRYASAEFDALLKWTEQTTFQRFPGGIVIWQAGRVGAIPILDEHLPDGLELLDVRRRIEDWHAEAIA
jgi:hypothetical protein